MKFMYSTVLAIFFLYFYFLKSFIAFISLRYAAVRSVKCPHCGIIKIVFYSSSRRGNSILVQQHPLADTWWNYSSQAGWRSKVR